MPQNLRIVPPGLGLYVLAYIPFFQTTKLGTFAPLYSDSDSDLTFPTKIR
jgi:hypothetical protein